MLRDMLCTEYPHAYVYSLLPIPTIKKVTPNPKTLSCHVINHSYSLTLPRIPTTFLPGGFPADSVIELAEFVFCSASLAISDSISEAGWERRRVRSTR